VSTHHSTSPSLRSGDGAAFELKFLVPLALATEVETFARTALRMAPDAHGDPSGSYLTTSLYLDTAQLDVYHRSDTYRRRKHRVRRYGNEARLYLERKVKSNDRVSKRRAVISEADLSQLGKPMSLETWDGHWFHRRVTIKRLGPACLVAYRRTALAGACAEGPLRVTIDRDVRARPQDGWRIPPVSSFEHSVDVFAPGAPQAVLELKFMAGLPLPFKQLVERFRLSPIPASKYRLATEALSASGTIVNLNREAARA